MLEVHGVYGTGIHRLGSFPGGLWPRPFISQEGPNGHSQREFRFAVSSWKGRKPCRRVCGTRGHRNPLLNLLRGAWLVRATRRGQRGGLLPTGKACAGPRRCRSSAPAASQPPRPIVQGSNFPQFQGNGQQGQPRPQTTIGAVVLNPFSPFVPSQNSSEQPQVVQDWTSVPPPQQS